MTPNDRRAYIRTDLAAEVCTREDGAEYSERGSKDVRVVEMKLGPESAERAGKPAGSYITIYFDRPWLVSDEVSDEIADRLAAELRVMLDRFGVGPGGTVLVAGLGNSLVTSDSVGPLAVRDVLVTRHIRENDEKLFATLGQLAVAALAPGVVGQTGVETAELILGTVERVKPDAVIVIDALAARSPDRLSTTIQLTDTGIAPGSGIGNRRRALDTETLGVPVAAVGVPTIVDSATLVADALEKAGFTELPEALETVLETGRSFFVSPKDCDTASAELARLIATALNSALSAKNYPAGRQPAL